MENTKMRTAKEAGWHLSHYNISSEIPGSDNKVIANLVKGVCTVCTPLECYLMDVLDELNENHPIIERFAKRGLIANFDERSYIDALGRSYCSSARSVGLTICPTMGCNFDCPYCFENHKSGFMSAQIQDAVVELAEKLMRVTSASAMDIVWFGGEPLLAPRIIESLSERLMELARKNDIPYMAKVVTNGYLLTRETEEILEKAGVKTLQITLDGTGDTHNLTRHLANGGPTFDRIIENIRNLRYPFHVAIRHNVHEDNKSEMESLRALVRELDRESPATIQYYAAVVARNSVTEERDSHLAYLCSSDAGDVGVVRDAGRFRRGKGHVCMAHSLFGVGIDEMGRLYKCWEDVDKPEHSFGHVSSWDPADPIGSAQYPDMLTAYLNTAAPLSDPECRECIWLPFCSGGCPARRLFSGKDCVPYKDTPEKFAMALYERILNERETKKDK